MSAFFALVHFDGSPVDRDELQRIAKYFSRIGPDLQEVWTAPGVGLVHALLKTTPASINSVQPVNDGRYVIVGDVRIDNRQAMLAKLRHNGVPFSDDAADAAIMLSTWRIWGKAGIENLRGDFSAVIWDQDAAALYGFCDQLGVRRLYYACLGRALLVSNAMNAICEFPGMPRSLNDQSVMEFLAFGFNTNPASTIYKHVQALPPAHIMRSCDAEIIQERYWDFAPQALTEVRSVYDFVDLFKEKLTQAVNARLPDGDFAIAMSGGLDSTAVATLAAQSSFRSGRMAAHTLDISSLWPEDEELAHARNVGKQCGFPVYPHELRPEMCFQAEPEGFVDWLAAEPSFDSFGLAFRVVLDEMSEGCRVGLSGLGADPLMMSSRMHFIRLLQQGHWLRLTRDVLDFLRVHRRRPALRLRSSLKTRFERSPLQPGLPPWFRPEQAERAGLQARFEATDTYYATAGECPGCEREEALAQVRSPIWRSILGRFDARVCGAPIDFRHPFWDVNLVEFLLSMPASPWFESKQLLRTAMRGELPEAVRMRRKAMPRVSPVYRAMLSPKAGKKGNQAMSPVLAEYIDLDRYQRIIRATGKLRPEETQVATLPLNFSNWAQSQQL
ncbi:MAG: asparagine synthase-related protein [Pseudomonadota bacterium]